MKRVVAVAATALAAAAVAAAAPSGGGEVREVSIPGKVFVPERLDVLVGDSVVWRNSDSGSHTVTADNGSFDSGVLAPGSSFTQTFSKPGSYVYHCTIHKFMHGVVNAYTVVLSGPDFSVLSGGRVVLTGLAAAGTEEVTLDAISGTSHEHGVVPAADGSFRVSLRVFAPAAYRARVGGASSPLVRVAVSPRVRATARRSVVQAVARPARPGSRAVLQIYDREHFAWVTVAHGRLGRDSRVELSYAAKTPHAHLRVVVRGRDGWADGVSQTLVPRA